MTRLTRPVTDPERARRAARRDPDVAALRGLTPDEAAAWVDAQATHLAGARRVLRALARWLAAEAQG